jgi:hypothetical protein
MFVWRMAFMWITGGIIAALPLSAQNTYDGYTFVYSDKKAILYDMNKTVVNQWTTEYTIQACADLLRDSSIIVSINEPGAWSEKLVVQSGRFQIINWKGEVTWDFKYSSADYCPHHDIEPVYRTNDPKEKPTFLIPCYTKTWGDKIVEIRPTGKTTGEVVWEWVSSNHICESGCSDKADLLDKSKGNNGAYNKPSDAMHVNSVSYNRWLDQIVISNKGFNELIVIDHSTTTAEAKGATGGKYGKGGRILYRWGCPSNYGAPGTKQFSGQHHCCWVPDTLIGTNQPIPGGGNFMAVNNGGKKVVEIAAPDAKDGVYQRVTGQAFGPSSTLWSYAPSGLASNEGSIQKMPNGNYIICTGGVSTGSGSAKTTFSSGASKVYEVTSANKIVWQLDNFGTSSEGYRYAYGYLNRNVDVTAIRRAVVQKATIAVGRENLTGKIRITMKNGSPDARLSFFSLTGRELLRSLASADGCGWDLGNRLPAGTYLIRVVSAATVICEQVTTIQR